MTEETVQNVQIEHLKTMLLKRINLQNARK
jgi:hypothetical protein